MIDIVTITGADDAVEIKQLAELSKEFPFVEWAILVSETKSGQSRYPNREWLEKLNRFVKDNPLRLAGHVCGKWGRETCKGDWSFLEKLPEQGNMFGRLQLNISPYLDGVDAEQFINGIPDRAIIMQVRDFSNPVFAATKQKHPKVVPLYDVSGGKGLVPKDWIAPADCFCGYAGGLNPENLQEHCQKIKELVGNQSIWIDVESGIRTDEKFDFVKVRQFLQVAKDLL